MLIYFPLSLVPVGEPLSEESSEKHTCHDMSKLIQAAKTTGQFSEMSRSLWQYLWRARGGRSKLLMMPLTLVLLWSTAAVHAGKQLCGAM